MASSRDRAAAMPPRLDEVRNSSISTKGPPTAFSDGAEGVKAPRTPLRTFIGLVPEILIEIGIGNFLERLDLVHRYQVTIQVHELDADLLEGPLRQQVPFHSR